MEIDTTQIVIKVPRKEIVFLDQIFKAYEGLAMVTIDKKERGQMYLDVTEGTKSDVIAILDDLKQRIPLKIIKS